MLVMGEEIRFTAAVGALFVVSRAERQNHMPILTSWPLKIS